MAKKQIKTSPEVVAAAPAAVSKKGTMPGKMPKAATAPTKSAPRVSAAKHSRTKSAAVAVEVPVSSSVIEPTVAAVPVENTHEAIAKIAYGYYVARGYQPGNQADDWFRAEREYYGR